LFADKREPELSARILSNVVELALADPDRIREAAWGLAYLGRTTESVALLDQARTMAPGNVPRQLDMGAMLVKAGRYDRAVTCLQQIVMNTDVRGTDHHPGILALTELNGALVKARTRDGAQYLVNPRLVASVELDLRVVVRTEKTNRTTELEITEPSRETASRFHSRTTIGGWLYRAAGVQEYTLKKALRGTYTIRIHAASRNDWTWQQGGYDRATRDRSWELKSSPPVTVFADIYTNYGRPNEKLQTISRRIGSREEHTILAKIKF